MNLKNILQKNKNNQNNLLHLFKTVQNILLLTGTF
jgi:hypothetical protein